MKTRNYHFDKIEICRNCQGAGMVKEERRRLSGLLRSARDEGTCPVCNGSGRVSKKTEITITVEAYKTDKTE